MTLNLKSFALLSLLVLVFWSCTEDNEELPQPLGDYENGILVLHEGAFTGGNGSVSYISDSFDTIENSVYENVNGQTLGTVAQSMHFFGNFAYIIVNVSNQIEIVNRYTFEVVTTIDTGLNNPRYMAIANGKAYITNWGDFSDTTDDYIAVLDLASNTIINTIATSYLPEELVTANGKIYVNTGTFGNGNVVDVINTVTDEVTESITVGNGPNAIDVDANGNVWVLTNDNLVHINSSDNSIVNTINITGASHLNYDNGNVYVYKNGSVFKADANATAFPVEAEISNVSFYDMRVENNILYGLNAADFNSDGTLELFDLNTNSAIQTFTVGLIPTEVYFN